MPRSVVVTGAGAGIGRAIATTLSREDWYVVGVERDPETAGTLADTIGGSGEAIVGDVSDRSVLQHARAAAEQAGQMAGWVNNAGVALGGALHAADPDDVTRVFEVNLLGVFWGCTEAVQSFIAHQTHGAIVNISSIHGRSAFPGWAAYDAAKGGVDALTRYIAVEYGPLGVRANAVAPGAIRTELVTRVIADADDPQRAELDMAQLHPLDRLGRPDAIASVVAFLRSDRASFVSGQSLAVDGAATARAYRYELSGEIAALRDAMP